jgi:hypothetical protein
MPKLTSTYTFETNESDYNLSEIDNLKIMIHAYNLAIQALATGKHSSYQLDTGQSSQRVTRIDLPAMISARAILIDELESRQSAAGLNRNAVTVYPCF